MKEKNATKWFHSCVFNMNTLGIFWIWKLKFFQPQNYNRDCNQECKFLEGISYARNKNTRKEKNGRKEERQGGRKEGKKSEDQIKISPKIHVKNEDNFISVWIMIAISKIKPMNYEKLESDHRGMKLQERIS